MMRDGFFTEADSVEVVTARNRGATDARLAQVMEVITRKLHEAVKEIEPTQDEWMAAIQFLTRTGHMCNEWRQEFILLSDVLGCRCSWTRSTTARRPGRRGDGLREHGARPLLRGGRPRAADGRRHLPRPEGRARCASRAASSTPREALSQGARIDVWQANDEGFYDVQQKGHPAGLQPARRVPHGRTGATGSRGVKPSSTRSRRRPVGQLLSGSGGIPTGPRISTT
jgi:catechol 1,2-dioxygenase